MLSRDDRRDVAELWSERSSRGMVVTAHYRATAAAVEILEAGGNAFDAAVAASLALSVCEAAGSGLGGMAMGLVRCGSTGRVTTVEGPCRAPKRATPKAVAKSNRYRGYASIAVPTHVRVLAHLLERYGTQSRECVLAPAIRIAEQGFLLTPLQHRLIEDECANPMGPGSAAQIFLDERGRPLAAGTLFRQPQLATTLRRLAADGFEDFYKGAIAREIATDVEAGGGFIRADDLAELPAPREAEPLRGHFGADEVLTVGPPAGGLALIQMLQTLAALESEEFDPDRPEDAVRLAAVIRRAREDRRRLALSSGPDQPGESAALLDPAYAAATAAVLREKLAGEGETSHVCTMDADGNVVSLTQSIERSFGAGVATPSLGFLYNGYLKAFKVENQRHPHYLSPGAPARSNAAPTIVLHEGRPVAALGSTGSELMVSGIFQVLVRLRRQSPFEASHAPRLHCTPEGEVLWEQARFADGVGAALTRSGLRLTALDPYAFRVGGLQLIACRGVEMIGVSEPRRDGAAGGPRG